MLKETFTKLNMQKIPNIAVIGCGYWGKNIVRNFYELGALRAICDPNPEVAEAMASKYKVPSQSWTEILKNPAIDGVAIVTPAAQHANMCVEALKAGKHVFVEKPLALTMPDADLIEQAVKASGKHLIVGHLLQYHPAVKKIQAMVAEGALGKLLVIRSHRLNLGKIRNEETVLWSFAPHDLSVLLSLVNESPTKVQANGKSCFNDSIEDTTTVQLEFPSGLQAEVVVSWMHPFKEQKLVVVGEKGMIVFDDTLPLDQKLQFYGHHCERKGGVIKQDKKDPIAIQLDTVEPLKAECQHLLDCINNLAKPLTDVHEGKRVLKVLNEAQNKLDASKAHAKPSVYVHPSSYVDDHVSIGQGTKIWHFSHILHGSTIGQNCVIGQNVMIGPDVSIGANCKIQNNVSLYKGVALADGVFCGPSCVFTNVYNPRSEVERKEEFLPTKVGRGVTIGANATIVCGVTLGDYCFIGAGSVVTKDVPPHACVVGNPAKQIGWRSHAGEKLEHDLQCPREGRTYQVNSLKQLEELSTK
jgi:predicted dehydrogenase